MILFSRNSFCKSSLLLVLLGLTSKVMSQETLTPRALFMRCYAQLTQSRVPLNDPLLLQVKITKNSPGKDPIDACMEVFDKAHLDDTGEMETQSDVGKKVLITIHRLHASWFEARDFKFIGISSVADLELYDVDTPAFYFTRALFQPERFDYIVTADKHLEAMRIISDPPPEKGVLKVSKRSDFIFKEASFHLASAGELIGVRETDKMSNPYTYTTTKTFSGTVDLGGHFGGGILGSQVYLLLNINEDRNFLANGGGSMPRKWARAIFSDLLCRELPVVRYTDVENPTGTTTFTDPGSPVAFRQTQGCVQCHASMDRMAGAIRGFRYFNIGADGTNVGGCFARFLTPTKGSGAEWPKTPDPNYALKDPDGVFFFRNYKGQPINQTFTGLAALGNVLKEQDDLYVCAAKRYYSYFLGVDVPMGDPGVPLGVPTPSPNQIKHKNQVEKLGQDLKKDPQQSLRTMIYQILKLEAYSKSDFN